MGNGPSTESRPDHFWVDFCIAHAHVRPLPSRRGAEDFVPKAAKRRSVRIAARARWTTVTFYASRPAAQLLQPVPCTDLDTLRSDDIGWFSANAVDVPDDAAVAANLRLLFLRDKSSTYLPSGSFFDGNHRSELRVHDASCDAVGGTEIRRADRTQLTCPWWLREAPDDFHAAPVVDPTLSDHERRLWLHKAAGPPQRAPLSISIAMEEQPVSDAATTMVSPSLAMSASEPFADDSRLDGSAPADDDVHSPMGRNPPPQKHDGEACTKWIMPLLDTAAAELTLEVVPHYVALPSLESVLHQSYVVQRDVQNRSVTDPGFFTQFLQRAVLFVRLHLHPEHGSPRVRSLGLVETTMRIIACFCRDLRSVSIAPVLRVVPSMLLCDAVLGDTVAQLLVRSHSFASSWATCALYGAVAHTDGAAAKLLCSELDLALCDKVGSPGRLSYYASLVRTAPACPNHSAALDRLTMAADLWSPVLQTMPTVADATALTEVVDDATDEAAAEKRRFRPTPYMVTQLCLAFLIAAARREGHNTVPQNVEVHHPGLCHAVTGALLNMAAADEASIHTRVARWLAPFPRISHWLHVREFVADGSFCGLLDEARRAFEHPTDGALAEWDRLARALYRGPPPVGCSCPR